MEFKEIDVRVLEAIVNILWSHEWCTKTTNSITWYVVIFRPTALPVRPVYVEIVRLGRDVGQALPRREDDALDGLPVGIAPEESLRGAAAAHRQPVRPPCVCKIFQDHSNLNFIWHI